MGMKFVSALMEEHTLRVFENRVLKTIFGSKREETTGGWRIFIMRSSFTTGTLHQVLITVIKSERMRCAELVICMGNIQNIVQKK